MDRVDIMATMEQDSLVSDDHSLVSNDGSIQDPGQSGALPKLIPGSVIPGTRLKIVRWLGQGGVGVVFEVRHLDIERRYAAKLLNLARNPKRTLRFREEARTISQLGSPFIIEVFDFQELPDGRLMFLMELIEGPSLSVRCRDHGPIELARLLGLARQVCKGLDDAHTRGFVHRDIKPDNIMVGLDANGREQVKLVDFGLATLQGSSRNRNRGGTPAYMSPEQCQGLDLDVRTDIYSLGVSLYELSCGRLPFEGDDEKIVRQAHLDDTPTPPSTRGGPELPAEFDALILRCMAKLPEERYESAAELEAALIELQLGLGLRTAWDELPPPALEDPRRQAHLEQGLADLRSQDRRRARRRRWIGVGLVALVVVSAGLGLRAQQDALDAARKLENDELEQLRERAEAAASLARWVYPGVSDPEGETSLKVVLEVEAKTITEADELAGELREQFASTLVALGDTYWDVDGGQGFATEFYIQALIFVPDHPRARERTQLRPTALIGLSERAAKGEFERSELAAVKTLETLAVGDPNTRRADLQRLIDEDALPPRDAADLARVLRSHSQTAEPELVASAPKPTPAETGEALPESESAEPLDTEPDALPPTKGPQAGSSASGASKTLSKQAKAAYDRGETSKAERLYRQALTKSSRNTDALVGLHRINFDRGDFREALDFAERAVTLRPKQGNLRIYAGDSCVKVHDYKRARKHYNEAKQLGVASATKRLSMLAEKTGSG